MRAKFINRQSPLSQKRSLKFLAVIINEKCNEAGVHFVEPMLPVLLLRCFAFGSFILGLSISTIILIYLCRSGDLESQS